MSLSLDKNSVLQEINNATSKDAIEKIRIHYLGKKGLISIEMKSLSSKSMKEKKIKGQELNNFKSLLESSLQIKKSDFEKKELIEKLEKEKIDTTFPPRDYNTGKIHPISQTISKVIEIFGHTINKEVRV